MIAIIKGTKCTHFFFLKNLIKNYQQNEAIIVFALCLRMVFQRYLFTRANQ